MKKIRLRTRLSILVACLSGMLLLSQCTDEGVVPNLDIEEAASISALAGNNQYSLHGTELPEPLTVEVKGKSGAPVRGAAIRFTPTQGGGSVSDAVAVTDERGRASTRMTLGSANGPNQVRASVEASPGVAVVFDATSADFFCAEAEDSLQICGDPTTPCTTQYGPKDDLFLVTNRSDLYPTGAGGIVEANISSEKAFGFAEIPIQNFFDVIVWDGVFSPRGDYYAAGRRQFTSEIIKIDTDGNLTRFTELTATAIDYAVELAANPLGLLVGCDNNGPFVVRCRDTVLRFSAAMYNDGINNDAVAVDPRTQSQDPLGEDIYFINTMDQTLYRLPMDSLDVEPQGLQSVALLTQDQASGASGMVCDDLDGSIYIVVEMPLTKELLKVTPAGTVTQLFDFFSRGTTDPEAGVQSDLAFRRPFLFTLDTLNDKLLVYDIADVMTPLFSDSLEQAKLSARNTDGTLQGGERVGLDVLK